jgi:chromosome segregation ATPase
MEQANSASQTGSEGSLTGVRRRARLDLGFPGWSLLGIVAIVFLLQGVLAWKVLSVEKERAALVRDRLVLQKEVQSYEALIRQIPQLEDKRNQLQTAVAEMEGRTKSLEGQQAILTVSVNEKSKELREAESLRDQVKGKKEALDRDISDLQKQSGALSSEVRNSKEELGSLRKNIEDAKTDLGKRTKESAEMTAQVQKLGGEVAKLEGRHQAITQEIDSLTGPKSDLAKSASRVSEFADGLARSQSRMEEAVDRTVKKIESDGSRISQSLSEEGRKLQSTVGALDESTREFSRLSETLNRSVTGMAATATDIKSTLDGLRKDIETHIAELKKSSTALQDDARSAQSASSTIDASMKRLESASSETDAMAKRIKEIEGTLTSAMREVSPLMGDLKATTASLQKEVNRFVAHSTDAIDRLNREGNKILDGAPTNTPTDDKEKQ